MAMHDGLSGNLSYIDTDIESNHFSIFEDCCSLGSLEKKNTCLHLGNTEFEKVANVSFRDYQTMERSNREPVMNDNREFVLRDDPLRWQFAEYAHGLSNRIGFPDGPEVGVIPVLFHSIVRIAEGLQVTQIIGPPFVAGDDVIHFQRDFIGRDPAQFTTELCRLEHLEFQRSADVSG